MLCRNMELQKEKRALNVLHEQSVGSFAQAEGWKCFDLCSPCWQKAWKFNALANITRILIKQIVKIVLQADTSQRMGLLFVSRVIEGKHSNTIGSIQIRHVQNAL